MLGMSKNSEGSLETTTDNPEGEIQPIYRLFSRNKHPHLGGSKDVSNDVIGVHDDEVKQSRRQQGGRRDEEKRNDDSSLVSRGDVTEEKERRIKRVINLKDAKIHTSPSSGPLLDSEPDEWELR
jgi:hypothetical protein